MRDFLTGLAVAVILVLTAALAGPYFVNWTAHRDRVEREIAHALGRPVQVAGEIKLRLLPTPVLQLAKLTVGADPNAPVLAAESVSLEIATASLLRGEIRVLDATLDGARLDLTLDERGRIAGGGAVRPNSGATPIAVERFVVRRSTFFLHDVPGGPGRLVTGIDAEARAPSLAGPWRVTGRGSVGGRVNELRLSTGEPEPDGAFRMRAAMFEPEGRRIDFDGRVGADAIEGKLQWAGKVALPGPEGLVERNASASAMLRARGRAVTLDAVEIDGGEETGLKLTGKGAFELGAAGGLSLDLEARTLDLDRAAGGDAVRAPFAVAALWGEAIERGERDRPTLPLRIGLSVPAVLLGGDTVRDVFFELRMQGRAVRIEGFKAGLPGSAVLTASGDAGSETGLRFAGPISLTATDAPRLAGWLTGDPSGRSSRLGAGRLDFRGDVSASPGVIGMRIERLGFDRSSVSGVVRYAPREGTTAGRVQAQLSSERLVLDDLPDLSPLGYGLSGMNVTVLLDARNVGLLRAGVGAGRVVARLSSDENGLDVETLDIVDVAGATVRARGRLGPNGGRLTADAEVRRPEAAAAILTRFVPGPISAGLAERAPDLGPLRLSLVAERAAGEAAPVTFSLQGNAAGTAVSGRGEWPFAAGLAGLKATWTAESADVPQFLRQLGLETLPLPVGGRATATAEMDAATGKGSVRLVVPGGAAAADFMRQGEGATGTLVVEGEDWGPVLQTVGFPMPDLAARVPVTARARLVSAPDRITAEGLEARVAGQGVTGTLSLLTGANRIEGRLSTDRLDFSTLAAFALGPAAPPRAGSLWSSQRFTPPAPPRFGAALTLEAARLDLPFGPPAENAVIGATWIGERLELRLDSATLGPGTAAGSVALRRDGGRAAATARVALRGVPAELLLGRDQPLSGLVDLDLDGGSVGESPAGLVAGASGAGRIVLRDVRLAKLDPSAAEKAALGAEAAGVTDGRRVQEIAGRALEEGPFVAGSPVEFSVAVSGGAVKFGSFVVPRGDGILLGAGTHDLKTGRFDMRLVLSAAAPPKGWPAPPPEIAVVWRGSPGSPLVRDVDAGALANLLTTRAVSRELERIEVMELDMRERAFFMRRLRADRERAEQARRAAEEAARADALRMLGDAPPVQPGEVSPPPR